jgi:hypothetical protein
MQNSDILLQTLKHITNLEADEEQLFLSVFKPYKLKKNEHFLQATEVCTKLGFLCKGIVRYYVFRNEEEATLEFTKKVNL